MTIPDFENWKKELIITGKLPQDDDPPEDDYKWDRYMELLAMAEGIHEKRVFHALVDSLQIEYDNGVYEITIGLIFSFPPTLFGPALVESLPSLIERLPNKAGDLLSLTINDSCRENISFFRLLKDIQSFFIRLPDSEIRPDRLVPYSEDTFLSEFNKALHGADTETKEIIHQFILKEEENGWLCSKPGYFEPAFTS